jgi:putative DNA-invertase from lambdoid prophage Rac
LREYAAKHDWTMAVRIKKVLSGAAERELRKSLLTAVRCQNRSGAGLETGPLGRSLVDLIVTLKELPEPGVSFASRIETLDLTTPTGRAMAG